MEREGISLIPFTPADSFFGLSNFSRNAIASRTVSVSLDRANGARPMTTRYGRWAVTAVLAGFGFLSGLTREANASFQVTVTDVTNGPSQTFSTVTNFNPVTNVSTISVLGISVGAFTIDTNVARSNTPGVNSGGTGLANLSISDSTVAYNGAAGTSATIKIEVIADYNTPVLNGQQATVSGSGSLDAGVSDAGGSAVGSLVANISGNPIYTNNTLNNQWAISPPALSNTVTGSLPYTMSLVYTLTLGQTTNAGNPLVPLTTLTNIEAAITLQGASPQEVVPEPATWASAGIGVLLMAGFGLRRKALARRLAA
jgi:hypothetical protein